MLDKPYRLGILVGRFQMLHAGHEMMIRRAIELCERTAVFVGSSQESGTAKNPFTYETRKSIIESVFKDAVSVYPLPDIGVGNNPEWGDYVMKTVKDAIGSYPDLVISGRESRRTSWVSDEYGVDELFISKSVDISASRMREMLIENDYEEWKKYVDPVLQKRYNELREAVLLSKDNTNSESM